MKPPELGAVAAPAERQHRVKGFLQKGKFSGPFVVYHLLYLGPVPPPLDK